jgi:hypothetical protein
VNPEAAIEKRRPLALAPFGFSYALNQSPQGQVGKKKAVSRGRFREAPETWGASSFHLDFAPGCATLEAVVPDLLVKTEKILAQRSRNPNSLNAKARRLRHLTKTFLFPCYPMMRRVLPYSYAPSLRPCLFAPLRL